MDCDVFKLWLNKTHPASMKTYAAKFLLDTQLREESDHTKALSEETQLYFDSNATSLYMSPPDAAPSSCRTELLTHDIARL